MAVAGDRAVGEEVVARAVGARNGGGGASGDETMPLEIDGMPAQLLAAPV